MQPELEQVRVAVAQVDGASAFPANGPSAVEIMSSKSAATALKRMYE